MQVNANLTLTHCNLSKRIVSGTIDCISSDLKSPVSSVKIEIIDASGAYRVLPDLRTNRTRPSQLPFNAIARNLLAIMTAKIPLVDLSFDIFDFF